MGRPRGQRVRPGVAGPDTAARHARTPRVAPPRAALLTAVLLASLTLGTTSRAPVVAAADHGPLSTTCGDGGCQEELSGGSGAWRLQVYRNLPLSGSAAVTRAVVVVHGTDRNADDYFSGMMAAAEAAGVTRNTLVVAPRFPTAGDDPGSGAAVWTSGAWKRGDGATSPKGLSSFAVMDQLLSLLASTRRFPNLTHITVAGHSAGGQFVQRYAAFGIGPASAGGVSVSFVPANPSSYLYFGPTRPRGTGFAVPGGGSCPDYDDYKYGMNNRSGYPARLTPTQALATYAGRRVVIINGGADTTDNGDLDTDCGAMLEGPNRAARGANYARYIRSVAPSALQSRVVVPGVDHDGDEIFASPLARSALFGGNP